MKRLIQIICNALTQGENLMMATIVTAPDQARLCGARMLIRSDGTIHGTIGGGLMEAETLQIALRIFARQSARFHLLEFCGEAAPHMKAPCGSGTTVLIEHITATPDNREIFRKLLEARQKGIKSCLLTHLDSDAGRLPTLHRQLICEGNVLRGMPTIRHPGISALLEKAATIRSPVIESVGGGNFFLNPWIVPSMVYLFGAGHVAQEVAELTVKAGFRTVVLDDRAKFANPDRFPTADDIIVLESFENAFHGLELDRKSHVVIVTRGHRHEKGLLRQALATPAGYIGVIGSIRKRDALFREMSAEGFSIDDLLRIYCPIGVNVLAESPLEIAVSIVAQLIHLRGKRLADKKRDVLLLQTGQADPETAPTVGKQVASRTARPAPVSTAKQHRPQLKQRN
jgi:xanthine dehydrogenase accessory factor